MQTILCTGMGENTPDIPHGASLGPLTGGELPQDDAKGVDVHLVGAAPSHQQLGGGPRKGARHLIQL